MRSQSQLLLQTDSFNPFWDLSCSIYCLLLFTKENFQSLLGFIMFRFLRGYGKKL